MQLSTYLFLILFLFATLFVLFLLAFRFIFAPLSTGRLAVWSFVLAVFLTTLLGLMLRSSIEYDCGSYWPFSSCGAIVGIVLVLCFFISWLVLHLMLFFIGPAADDCFVGRAKEIIGAAELTGL